MKKIGILGDICSGKSIVAKHFGYPVFNADKEVSKIYSSNKSCYLKLNKKLPKHIKTFPIKKEEISSAIIENFKNLKKIVNIVHPIVRKKMKIFLKKNKKKKLVVLDIPLLIENKMNKKNFILIYVDASKSEINKRLKKRLNYNKNLINNFRKAQKPLNIKKKMSDFTINNNFRFSTLKKRIKLIKKSILKNERSSSRY
tara:strand:+ start:2926 stop:3522 length:597 start_codon:yes stop_codon:yes gene_type:complete